MLKIRDNLVDGMLEVEAGQLYDLLGAPTLFHFPGRREQPLFVTVLLHGNEDSGWIAVRELLRKYQGDTLPRSLSLFVGNVEAARQNQRRLAGQPDYNRIWPGGKEHMETPEARMMQQVVDEMVQRDLFASIDIHNNTGINPHYACVRRMNNSSLHLATLFSRTVVYFRKPDGVQVEAFADVCPAVTLECGQPGQEYGPKHALDFLDACVHMQALPDHPVAEHDIDVFKTVATVKVPTEHSFGFGQSDTDIRFVDDLDHLNFRELPSATTLGWVRPGSPARLDVRNDVGEEVGERYFSMEQGEIRTRTPLMPSMLTVNSDVIRQDCLCYLMERESIRQGSPTAGTTEKVRD